MASRGFSGIAGVEGEPTGDGRVIDRGALHWKDSGPINIGWRLDGHHPNLEGTNGAVVGLVQHFDRANGGDIHVTGWLNNEDEGARAIAEVANGSRSGVSFILDKVDWDYEYLFRDGEAQPYGILEHIKSARIRRLDLVATPAFASAHIGLTGDTAASTQIGGDDHQGQPLTATFGTESERVTKAQTAWNRLAVSVGNPDGWHQYAAHHASFAGVNLAQFSTVSHETRPEDDPVDKNNFEIPGVPDSGEVIAGLHRAAALFGQLHDVAKTAHWNQAGPGFIAVHPFIDKIADKALDWRDAAQERLRAYGEFARLEPRQPALIDRVVTPTEAAVVLAGFLADVVEQLTPQAQTSPDIGWQSELQGYVYKAVWFRWFLLSEYGNQALVAETPDVDTGPDPEVDEEIVVIDPPEEVEQVEQPEQVAEVETTTTETTESNPLENNLPDDHTPEQLARLQIVEDAARFRVWTREEREQAAENGEALPDGSFPIRDVADLRNAIRAVGRADDEERARRHIIARAADLDATDELPEGWVN